MAGVKKSDIPIKSVAPNKDGKRTAKVSARDRGFSVTASYRGTVQADPPADVTETNISSFSSDASDAAEKSVQTASSVAFHVGRGFVRFLKGSGMAVVTAAKSVGRGYATMSEKIGEALHVPKKAAGAGVGLIVVAAAFTGISFGINSHMQQVVQSTDAVYKKAEQKEVSNLDVSDAVAYAGRYGKVEYDLSDGGESSEGEFMSDSQQSRKMKLTSPEQVENDYNLDMSLKFIHAGWYEAWMEKSGSYPSVDNPSTKISVSKNDVVIVMHTMKGGSRYLNSNPGKCCCVRLKGGKTAFIPLDDMSFVGYLYNSSGTYTKEQVEAWCAQYSQIQVIPWTGEEETVPLLLPHAGNLSRTHKNPARYMLWVSRFNQHSYLLEYQSDGWKLSDKLGKPAGCGTAAHFNYQKPNDVYNFNQCGVYTFRVDPLLGRCCSYASFTGGNTIHHGGGGHGHPRTHGCIALSRKYLNWVNGNGTTSRESYGAKVVTF